MSLVQDLDPTFGTGGIVTTDVWPSADYACDVAIRGDGRILLAGSGHNGSNYDFALVRYKADGSLDTSFGGMGKITTAIGVDDNYAYGMALQSDGKIVVVGNSDVDSSGQDTRGTWFCIFSISPSHTAEDPL